MKSRYVIAVCMAGVLFAGSASLVHADATELKEKIAAIDKELAPIKGKAQNDADFKAANEVVKAAEQKRADAFEAAIIKVDPKAKDLLEQRKKLQAELVAMRKTEPEKKKAPAEKKAE